jgi:cytochrome c-type biogenesis protein
LDFTLTTMVLLPLGLGLLGFIEPCSIGSTLLFVKYLEGKSPTNKLSQAIVFAGTRAVFIGLLGVLAVLVGDALLGFQRAAWIILGAVYILLGLPYLIGKTQALRLSLGLNLGRISPLRGSSLIGVFFGLNIPACATPLIFALLATAAASGSTGATVAGGFVSLGLFGLALSLPLVAVLLFKPGGRALDKLASLSQRLPFWTGLILIVLGAWSIWFGMFAKLQPA